MRARFAFIKQVPLILGSPGLWAKKVGFLELIYITMSTKTKSANRRIKIKEAVLLWPLFEARLSWVESAIFLFLYSKIWV
jgi:hypothetical protein